ncbi:MAG: hypothetical protein ABH885_00060 [Candidatus Omnitrophota bacterium]
MDVFKVRYAVLILAVWLALWANFIARDLFFKGALRGYLSLSVRDEDGRRAYVYGDIFYGLLKYAKGMMPEGAAFELKGVEPFSLEYRRAVYYLYPHLESDNADYVIAFGTDFENPRYEYAGGLDAERKIFRRK